ncbi:MAG: amidohydrolase family protein [Candidatus Freyarchaeum deiterrae]
MVISVHGHILNKDMWSDTFWDWQARTFQLAFGIPKEMYFQQILPQVAGFNAEGYVKVMETAGIDKALVMGVDWGMSVAGEAKWSVEEMNHWVAKQVDEYPDKLAALCAVDPRRGERAVKLLAKAVEEWGMKGLKFHPTAGYYPDDPKYFPLYKKCVELDVPLHSHTAVIMAPMESKFADPIHLDSVAAHFPELKIIAIHFGGLCWMLKCMDIMCFRPNVYAEISAQQPGAAGMPQYWLTTLRNILNVPALVGSSLKERIMFGTDSPLITTVMGDDKWVDWIKNIPEKAKEYGLNFTQEEVNKILSENAKRILKL